MAKSNIKIEKDTHRQLIEVVSKLQLERGKRCTIDEAIKELVKRAKIRG